MKHILGSLGLILALTAAPAVAGPEPPKLRGDIGSCGMKVYISTNDTAEGTLLGRHGWGATSDNNFHFSCYLTPGTRNYLHIMIEPPNDRIFFGYFQLTKGARFVSNGLRSLDTRPAYWKSSSIGFGRDLKPAAVAPGGDVYIRQDPVMYKLCPSALTLMDPVVGSGHPGKVFFTTAIDVDPLVETVPATQPAASATPATPAPQADEDEEEEAPAATPAPTK